MGKQSAPSDPNRLWQTIFAFIEAATWPEAEPLVEERPELLSDEADVLLEHLIAVAHEQGDTDAEHIFGKIA